MRLEIESLIWQPDALRIYFGSNLRSTDSHVLLFILYSRSQMWPPQQQLHKEMSKIDRERSQQKAHCLKEVDNKMTSDAMEKRHHSDKHSTCLRPSEFPWPASVTVFITSCDPSTGSPSKGIDTSPSWCREVMARKLAHLTEALSNLYRFWYLSTFNTFNTCHTFDTFNNFYTSFV